jgi:hypothetical protein
MSSDEKLHLFDEVCCVDPTKFTFLPGEEFSILAAAEKARAKNLNQISLSKTVAATGGGRKRPAVSSTRTAPTPIENENQLLPPKKRQERSTIIAYIGKWL